MPEINIKSCDKTSNYDALSAIIRFMSFNTIAKNYLDTRKIVVSPEVLIEVRELDHDDLKSICSCSFEVENISAT